MSRREQNVESKNYVTTSNESIQRKEVVQTNQSQSINSESYDFINQKTTSKTYITETPINSKIQQSNSRYSSNNQKLNSNVESHIQTQAMDGNINLSNLMCTCSQNQSNEKSEKSELKDSCSDNKKKLGVSIGNQFQKQLFEEEKTENKISNEQGGYTIKTQEKIITSSKIYGSNTNNMNENININQADHMGSMGNGQTSQSKTIITNTKIITNNSINPNLQAQIFENNKSTYGSKSIMRSNMGGKMMYSNICTCSKNALGKNVNMKKIEIILI